MSERDVHVLISIAKIDAALHTRRVELGQLPARVARVAASLVEIESREADSAGHVEDMSKERRAIEQQLEDNAEKIKKLRVQLMEVKTNKEYTAMLHEIGHVESDTEAKEERLLILMDEFDQESEQNTNLMEDGKRKKAELAGEQATLEARIKTLESEMQSLEAQKPKLLAELNPPLRKKYDRLLDKLQDFAVTNVIDETCQGCFTRIPPQTTVEIKKNDRIIRCEACGRMLVHYDTELP